MTCRNIIYTQKINMACKHKYKHTKCPKDYIEWTVWADKMVKDGYKQVTCTTCGRCEIWTNIPVKKRKKIHLSSYNVYI
jgi:hypothetical protein